MPGRDNPESAILRRAAAAVQKAEPALAVHWDHLERSMQSFEGRTAVNEHGENVGTAPMDVQRVHGRGLNGRGRARPRGRKPVGVHLPA